MRTGIVAKKIGMSRFFKPDGTNIPVTLLKVDNCKVIEHKSIEKDGYLAVKLSFGISKKSKINKPTSGYFKKIKSESSNYTREFRVTENGLIELGKKINANHFVNGQMVDVSGLTIGKGFAGGMKRHNFAGNRASHGVSISHRSHGSTGQCQDPGKVFKGKKMAGRLGNVKRTMQNLEVLMTDNKEGLLVIKGSIPGPKGLFVSVKDSIKTLNKDLPYPTNADDNLSSSMPNQTIESEGNSLNDQTKQKGDSKNNLSGEQKVESETKSTGEKSSQNNDKIDASPSKQIKDAD